MTPLRHFLRLVPALLLTGRLEAAQQPSGMVRDTDVAIPMRDSVRLRADIVRPAGEGPFPVLVYRTPYDKRAAVQDDTIFQLAVERGYAVVIQDVRGRYASDGSFDPYRQEGRDGYDTIEWAAAQPWSNGAVGTFGLSYAGAAQWLAAFEGPPHLRAMVPAMTYGSPRSFFYSGGVWDLSWISWIWFTIAPEERVRHDLPGPRTEAVARASWVEARDRFLNYLPLNQLEALRSVAPWYFEWLDHLPTDPWWNWADLTGKYRKTKAAVLNLSGWYDEAYGPAGAIQNYRGLRATRRMGPSRTALIIGPWVHGASSIGITRAGDRKFGDSSALNYDELVLRWMDRYVKGLDNGVDQEKPVRIFAMGENRWLESDRWPLPATTDTSLYLAMGDSTSTTGQLTGSRPTDPEVFSVFVSNPARPLTDPFAEQSGAHDYHSLVGRDDILTFDSAPLEQALSVVGAISAEIFLSTDARDLDLWVRVLDVAPDGTAYNLMSPGSDVLRASLRNGTLEPQLLRPGRIYRLSLPGLLTGNVFLSGHRVRIQISGAFFPWFSRNLQSGESEVTGDLMQTARITVYHDRLHRSRIVLPVQQAVSGER